MKRSTWLTLLLIALLGFATAQELDLTTQTLDGLAFCGVTVDEATNVFGRPTAVKSNTIIADVAGPWVYYHNLGLFLMFASASGDPDQGLEGIVVHLSRQFDERRGQYFEPFPGSISPSLNANMKLNTVQALFEGLGYSTSLRTPEERREALEDLPVQVTGPAPWWLTLDVDTVRVQLVHEEVTKFLERVQVYCRPERE